MMLPDGWKKVKLGEIMSFKNGLNFTQVPNGKIVNFLGVGLFKDRKCISSEKELEIISLADYPNDDYLLKKDDLVFVRSNGSKELVGRCVKMQASFDKTTFSGFCIRGRLSKDNVISDYILNLIECGFLKEKLKKESGGTNISNLNQDILNGFEIILPPLEEQKKIAETLSVWDDAIEKQKKLIALKETEYQAYVSALIFKNRKFAQKCRIGDVLEIRNIRATATDDRPLYSLTIEDGVTPKSERYDRLALVKDKDSKKYKVVCDGDIVFNPANLRWGAIARANLDRDVVVSPIYEVLYVKRKEFDAKYISQYLTSEKMISYYATKTEGTLIERKEVKLDAFLQIDIYVEKNIENQKKLRIF